MSQLKPLSKLSASSSEDLKLQAQLRRAVLASLFEELRSAATLADALGALREESSALLQLGLHDEAARLNALSRAVLGDVTRLTSEAQQLEARSALTTPATTSATPDLSTATASK